MSDGKRAKRRTVCDSVQTALVPGAHLSSWEGQKLLLTLVVCASSVSEDVMNKDQVKGRVKEVEGKSQEVAGRIVGDEDLKKKGKRKRSVGKLQSGYGDLKEDHKRGK